MKPFFAGNVEALHAALEDNPELQANCVIGIAVRNGDRKYFGFSGEPTPERFLDIGQQLRYVFAKDEVVK